MVFFQKPLTPPSLLEFSRHFFQRVLLQVFNTENIIIPEFVMGKVVQTLTNITRSFSSKLPQNYLKTASKLFDLLPFGKSSYLSHIFSAESFPKVVCSAPVMDDDQSGGGATEL